MSTMRILLLENETLAPLFPKMLAHYGFNAVVDYTSNMREALQWYNERAPYDVILAGFFDANGISLAAHIRRTNPTQVIGIMTAFAGEEPISRVHDLSIPVLRKPFLTHELVEFINQLKDRSR